MRIVAFGDTHMSLGEIRNIPGVDKADLIIINGDLTNYGSRHDAKKLLNEILSVNPSVYAQLGNIDKYEINDYLEELDLNLHGQARLFKSKVCFIGIGGSNITPFKTPTEFSEEELTIISGQAYSQGLELKSLAESLHISHIPVILVSHAPPYGTLLDRLRNGRHVGSRSVRTCIEKHQPDLCIVGHIHESRGVDAIDRTTIINPGMFRQGGWVDIQINHSLIGATLR